MTTEQLRSSELDRAARLLQAGQLVAFPTETVYGLGASVWDPQAIRALFQVKGRPADNPLIVHVHSREQVAQVAREIPAVFDLLTQTFWPGPLTCVLKRHPDVPELVSAGLDSVAVRLPSHPIARELIRRVGAPLVAPSANLSGRPSPTCMHHVLEDLDGAIAAVIDGGESEWGVESTVVSLLGESPVLLRPGSITVEQLEAVLGCRVPLVSTGPALAPGMKYRHYAPRCPVLLFDTLEALLETPLTHNTMTLTHPTLSSKNLYSWLRRADVERVVEIRVLCDAALQADRALMNRLKKAASGI